MGSAGAGPGTGARADDPLLTLREYRQLAPWSLRDLTTLAGAILDASAVRPVNAAASTHPTERTVRFYVTRRLVARPEGRGTAATYSYRHLLQVLTIKLRQMEGATLETIGAELQETTGDVLERRVASALGPSLQGPMHLPLAPEDTPPGGRSGQALHIGLSRDGPESALDRYASAWQHYEVTDGVQLHVRDDHPLASLDIHEREIADTVRLAVQRLIALHPDRRQRSGPTISRS